MSNGRGVSESPKEDGQRSLPHPGPHVAPRLPVLGHLLDIIWRR